MYRKLLRSEPELIAVIAKDKRTFDIWQKQNDFYDTKNIKWRYIQGKYSILGMKFTMLFLIEDFWRTPNFGKLTRLVHENMENKMRTFSTLEGIEHKFERR